MLCIEVNVEDLEKWTSLQKVIEIFQDESRFLQLKKEALKEVDRKKQIDVFKDFNALMRKAKEGTRLEADDKELLKSYRHTGFVIGVGGELIFADEVNTGFEGIQYGRPRTLWTMLDKLIQSTGKFPIPIGFPSEPSEIGSIYRRNLDGELNRRLFNHVLLVSEGQEKVATCKTEDCNRLFVPRREGKPQLYCTPICRSRQNMRDFRERQRG